MARYLLPSDDNVVFDRYHATLYDIGYNGYLTLKFEETEDVFYAVKEGFALIKQFV